MYSFALDSPNAVIYMGGREDEVDSLQHLQ